MKKIKVKYTIKNSENEITNFETIGTYDEEKREICYLEQDLEVKLNIQENKLKMIRKTDDYSIDFDFELNVVTKNKYELKSLGIYVDIEVETKRLVINENSINLKYTLINDDQQIGDFEYDLYWE
ncbi:MAG: DUF1934 family protein [Bacilli bacterium]|nr:DUF1934 family protein [Bacilli bacterium]